MFRRIKSKQSRTALVNTELFDAAFRKNWAIVRKLIKCGADVNAKAPDGMTLYDAAFIYSNMNMIRWLFSHGFNANMTNHTGVDYLQAALHDKSWYAAKILIRHGADVNKSMTDNPDKTFLHVAAENRIWDIVASLLKHGIRINPADNFIIGLFHQAAREGQLKVVQLLLKRNVDVNALDHNKKNALHHAIDGHNTYTANPETYISRLPVIKYLIRQRINVNAVYSVRNTALKFAADNHLGTIINLLLRNNADLNLIDDYTQKPFLSDDDLSWIAELQKNSDRNNYGLHMLLGSKYMIGSSIDPDDVFSIRRYMEYNLCHIDSKNESGYSLLYIAVGCNKPKSTKVLLEYGADINAVNNGCTIIQKAVIKNNPVILEIIARHASGINPQDANLLMHALAKQQKWQLVRHLARHHADLELKSESNVSLLLLAVRERNWKTVHSLLKHGAKPDLPAKEARRLLRHADKKGITQLAAQLRAQGVTYHMANKGSSSVAAIRSSMFYQEKHNKDQKPSEKSTRRLCF